MKRASAWLEVWRRRGGTKRACAWLEVWRGRRRWLITKIRWDHIRSEIWVEIQTQITPNESYTTTLEFDLSGEFRVGIIWSNILPGPAPAASA